MKAWGWRHIWWGGAERTGGGLGGEHLDASGGDLRQGDVATIRQRGTGIEPRADGKHRNFNEPVADRWGQPLRAVLPGDD